MTWTKFSANARKNTISLKEVKSREWQVLETRFITESLPRNLQSNNRLHEKNSRFQGFFNDSNLQE